MGLEAISQSRSRSKGDTGFALGRNRGRKTRRSPPRIPPGSFPSNRISPAVKPALLRISAGTYCLLMWRVFRWIWARLGDVSRIQWLTTGAGSTLLAALAGILGKVNGLPIHLWIPVGLAVLVLGIIACLLTLSLKERLTRSSLEIVFDASKEVAGRI